MALAAAPELFYFDEKTEGYLANKAWFNELLTDIKDDSYQRKVEAMLDIGGSRLIVNLNDIRERDEKKAKEIIAAPLRFLAPFQAALKEFIAATFGAEKIRAEGYTIGFDGSFGANKLTPRELAARHLGQLVAVEGIATRCSVVRPKVKRTVHYCEATNTHTENRYHDAVSIDGFPTSSVYPTKDELGNPLSTEFGLCEYLDYQTLSIQEMPEKAPPGLLPRSTDVILNDDLVDQCKPGDRIQVVGIFRALPRTGQGETSGLFKTVLIANFIKLIGKQVEQTNLTEEDLDHIRTIAQRPDIFDILSQSLAPSIFGQEYVKRSLVLLLLGGEEKNLENGTHIRGDINLLMVGDPSTAKSQLLRFVLNIAPLAINTTGRGSSGAGLTAAVTHDKETGERRLEAGAMVLADRGVVTIDEFDKMSDIDRVAIHEVMEQQTVTISKAGIQMSLNARCSVVAAANPRYGQYISEEKPQVNVNLPDSLLSRFDLVFIVLDHPDPEIDRAIADKVINNHRFKAKSSADMEDEEDKEPDEATQMWIKVDRVWREDKQGPTTILSNRFLKKYIEFAKNTCHPKLTSEAEKNIHESYIELRRKAASDRPYPMPVTARALETLIRLSTAHAKTRLSKFVEKKDTEIALKLLNYALDNDTQIDRPKERKDDKDGGDDDDGGEDGGEDGGDDGDDEAKERKYEGKYASGSGSADSGRMDVKASSQDSEIQVDELAALQRELDADSSDRSQSQSQSQEYGASPPRESPSKNTRSQKRKEMSSQQTSSPKRGSKKQQVQQQKPAEAPKWKGPLSADRLKAFTSIYSKYMRKNKEATIQQLEAAVNAEAQPSYPREEIESALEALQKQNKLMYKQGKIYSIAL